MLFVMDTRKQELRASLLVACVATVLAFCWQFAMVHLTYDGNWTSLFYIGEASRVPMPEELAGEHLYRFPGVVGHDGRFYHLIAHDPLFRRNFARDIDIPRVRYRRILVPGLAALLSFGHDGWVHPAFFSVILGFFFLGTFWLARWSLSHGHSVYWGFLFCVTPAALTSIPIMLVDVALAALTVGVFWYHEQKAPVKLFIVLVCAALARETGILVVIGYCAWLLFERHLRLAILYASAIVPAACWDLFVNRHTTHSGPAWLSAIPLYGFFHAFIHPFYYPAGLMEILLPTLDRLALIGMFIALVYVFRDALRPATRNYQTFIALAFAGLALFLAGGDVWPEAGAFSRNFTPLLLVVALSGILSHNWWRFSPLVLIAPRIVIPYLTEGGRMLRAIAHHV
jgi:hypothetical protein